MKYVNKSKKELIDELKELQQKYNSLLATNADELAGQNRELQVINKELLKAKLTAEENEERYKRIIIGITGYIYTAEVVNGSPAKTYHNDACIAVTGYSAKEFESDPYLWINMVAPEERTLVADSFLKLLDGKDVHSIEHRIIHKNGSTRWVNNILIPKHDPDGNLISYDGIITDITDRKQVELTLILRESYMIAVLENQPGPLWLKDINGTFIYVNTEFAKSCCEIDNPLLIYGKNDFDIFPPELAIKYVEDDKEFIKSGKPFIIEEYVNENGVFKWYEKHKTPIFDDKGTIIGSTGFEYDITERKQYELLLKEKNDEIKEQNEEYLQINEELQLTNQELKQAKERAEESDYLKTAFLQNMSHEIRTPMNAIMGFSDLIKDNYDNKTKLETFSEIIKLRCNDLMDIINDILDIAKIESGQFPVNFEECDLKELFAELSAFFAEYKTRIGKDNIMLSIQTYCNPEDCIIITDKVKLKQIFINLISNAFKFTDEGSIEAGIKSDENQKSFFYVSDSGIGIPKEKQNLVFERFTQLQQRSSKNLGGTGLGLSIVKGLVGVLGGEIFLKSEPKKGSTFTFTIPHKTIKTLHKETNSIEQLNNNDFSNKTILIVEDDFFNTEYLKEILLGTGLNILHVDNGKDAIEISLSQPVDLILMDVRLPDIDGYEVTRQIRYHKPFIQVIAQTAYATLDERPKALNAGCIDYISKPTKKDTLLKMLRKHLC